MVEFAKSINYVVYLVASAWDDVPASTFKKSWNKLLKFGQQIHELLILLQHLFKLCPGK